MNVVPFYTDEAYGGLAQCSGLLKDSGDALILEMQVKDAIVGVLKSGVTEIRIPIDEVVSLTPVKGWLGLRLVLQTSKVELLDAIPCASQGRVELRIARKDVDLAEHFMEKFHDPSAK